MTTLKRTDLVSEVQDQGKALGFDWKKGEAAEVLKAVENAVEKALVLGAKDELFDTVRLSFGTLKITEVPERSGVSKLQGQEKAWTSPAHKTARFKLATSLKEELKQL